MVPIGVKPTFFIQALENTKVNINVRGSPGPTGVLGDGPEIGSGLPLVNKSAAIVVLIMSHLGIYF